MMPLPIVARELRVAARARGLYVSRTLAAGLALVAGAVIWLTMQWAPPHEVGQAIFITVSWLAFLACLGSGLWLTCDTLSEEKRAGTLGLLFLTDLRGYDVILGKLAAGALNAAGGVLAVVPVLGLTILMGGMTMAEIGRTALALAAALMFSLSFGLLISAQLRTSRQVFGWTLFLLMIISAALPVIGGLWLERWEGAVLGKILLAWSPGCAMVCAPSSIYTAERTLYWSSLGATAGMGAICLLTACWIIPRQWQAADETFRAGSLREMWHRFGGGGTRWRARFRARTLPRNPYLWLCSRDRWTRYLAWIPFAAMAFIWAWGIYEERRRWFDEGIYIATCLIMSAAYKLWLGYRAAQPLGEDRRMGTLELMLTTPLTPRQILDGHWGALRRVFSPPLLFFALMTAGLGVAALAEHKEFGDLNSYEIWLSFSEDFLDGLVFWKYAAFLLVLAADIWAVGWLATWLSFRLAKPNRAAMIASLLVLPLPWLLWGVFLLLFIFLVEALKVLPTDMFQWNDRDYTGQIMLASWLGACVLSSAFWGLYARWRLLDYLRLVATTPVGTKPKYREASAP